MPKPDSSTGSSADIASALATEGGHLSVGRGGFTLHYRYGATLSGYDCDAIKAQSIAAGPPVIDSRLVERGAALQLAVNGPLVAVGREPDYAPWHSLSYTPLSAVAAAYAAAGAGRSSRRTVRDDFAGAVRQTGFTGGRPRRG